MTDKSFVPKSFFEINDFACKDIFVSAVNVWEVLPTIQSYIQSAFAQNRFQANYNAKKDIFIGEGTVVHPGAEIQGPAIIGRNCTIGHASFIRAGAIIGDNTNIGHAVEIKNSIILNNSAVAHLSYIGDSIVGSHVNIAGGVITANFRLDQKDVTVRHNGVKIDTGLQKFGAILGDGCSIGVNAILNPGTILAKSCQVFPLTSVRGFYEESTVIK